MKLVMKFVKTFGFHNKVIASLIILYTCASETVSRPACYTATLITTIVVSAACVGVTSMVPIGALIYICGRVVKHEQEENKLIDK